MRIGSTEVATISVIVPVLNDPEGLSTTVQSLLEQTYPAAAYEIIVVDNGSTDETPSIARAFAAKYPTLVQVLEEVDIRTSYSARNRGIKAARGEILCFIDANMTVGSDYLARVHARFESGDLDYLGCAVELQMEKRTFAGDYNRAFGFAVEHYLAELHFAPTCCLSITRSVIDRVGPFDGRLESSGDLEFGQRAYAAGVRQRFASEIVVHHPARASYRSLFGKERRLARGAAQLSFYYPERYGSHRRHFGLRYLLPQKPALIREKYRLAGVRIGPVKALAIAFWGMPLKWVRAREFRREGNRLQAQRS